MSPNKGSIHRDKRLMANMFSSEYCPFWTDQTRLILAIYFIMTLKYIAICNAQKKTKTAYRTPCSTVISLGYNSIYLTLFYLQHPQL